MRKLLLTTLLCTLTTIAIADQDDCHFLKEHHTWQGTNPTKVNSCTYQHTLIYNQPQHSKMQYELYNDQSSRTCPNLTSYVYINATSCGPDGASDDFRGVHGEIGSIYKNDHSLSLTHLHGYFDIISAQLKS